MSARAKEVPRRVQDPAFAPSFHHYVPPKPLAEFVGLFRYARGHTSARSTERVLPTGSVELVIKLGSGKTSHSTVAGPRSKSFLIERADVDELLGVHFLPGGAFPFLDFPYADLHNRAITLADLCGEARAARVLCELHEAASPRAKYAVLERWLVSIAARPLRQHRAVAFAVAEFQRDPVSRSSASVADSVGLSQGRFIRAFRDGVGLTPKLFCRVQRFQQVIQRVVHADARAVDWLDVAISAGYFDQSHFIHDFQEFSGVTPTEYLAMRTAAPNHLHVGD